MKLLNLQASKCDPESIKVNTENRNEEKQKYMLLNSEKESSNSVHNNKKEVKELPPISKAR